MPISTKKLLFLLLQLFLFLCGPALADESGVLSPDDTPFGRWEGTLRDPAARAAAPEWSLRTGFRKGVLDQTLPEEKEQAPDIAVLRSGWHAAWPELLAEFRESVISVEPDAVAGIVRHKPVLVIPSGGLDGLGSSVFFQAGLAHYVRSGGVLICMTQRKGSDLASLPVPDGATLDAAGWSEDSGPLYRRSSVRLRHPITAALERLAPSLETSGYLKTFPAHSSVLLSRQDGRPTALFYSYGKGWVVVTTLLSDYSHSQGLLPTDERTFLQGLLLWAKAGGAMRELAPAADTVLPLRLRGPLNGAASRVVIQVIGQQQNKPIDQQVFPLAVPAQGSINFSYAAHLPNNLLPGIYSLQYVLTDDQGQALTPEAECGNGWFAVLPAAPPAVLPPQPLFPLSVRFSAEPMIAAAGHAVKLILAITKISGPDGSYDMVIRAANQEKNVTLAGGRSEVSFDALLIGAGRPVPYAVDLAAGGALARGAVPRDAAHPAGVTSKQQRAAAGKTIRLVVAGLGSGAVTITGLGTEFTDHIPGDKTYDLQIPGGLPAGCYPIDWAFQPRIGGSTSGRFSVFVEGREIRSDGSTWKRSPDSDGVLTLKLFAAEQSGVTVRTVLVSPSGKEVLNRSTPAALAAGMNELPLAVPFKPLEAGIWQLRYDILTPLPEGPGFAAEPMRVASGRRYIDAGNAAVLALGTDLPVYYEPGGAVTVSALAFVRTRATMELFLDGKRVLKEMLTPENASLSYEAKGLSQGMHRAAVAISDDGLPDRRELAFLSGAQLPDLGVSIMTSDLTAAPDMEVGVGIINTGKTSSRTAQAELYEGDPQKGGLRIGAFTVPPLAPAKQHVMIFPWQFAGKAGRRTLTARVSQEQNAPERATDNNRAEAVLDIPDMLLQLLPRKNEFSADEEISFRIAVANFTAGMLPLLNIDVEVTEPSGRSVMQAPIHLKDIESGGVREVSRDLGAGAPQEGIYLISAQASADRRIASDSTGISVLPTLAAKGSLAATAAVAAPCRALDIRYSVRNAGTMQITGGSLKIEVRAKQGGQLVHAIQLPFAFGEQTHRINKIDFPRGDYLVTLRASVTSQPSGKNADLLLDERPLRISGPVELTLSTAALPRILVWSGGESGPTVERALSEKILREAIGDQGYFSKTVSSPEDFATEALSGLYTIYVLLDIDSTLDTADTLRAVLDRGHSVILAGSNARTRSLAEQLGIRFERLSNASYITFPAGSSLSLGGNIPFAGEGYSPSLKGAQNLAVFSNDQPAILSGRAGTGTLMVFPVSLIRSALAAGTSGPYSLLLKSMILSAAPEQEEGASVSMGQITFTSPTGPVKTRIFVPLSEGAQLRWSSHKNSVKNGTAMFELTADETSQRITYLVQTAKPEVGKRPIDVQYECEGAFLSQGKMEW